MRGGLPLNSPQADVVDHVVTSGRTVVSAGAGSGKTHTMLAAILELIELRRLRLDQVAMITFTNAAADEFRSRLQSELAARSVADPYWREQLELSSLSFIGTIHSFCRQLLRTYAYSGETARSDRISSATAVRRSAEDEVIESAFNAGSPLTRLAIPEYDLRQKLIEVYSRLRGSGVDISEVVAATERQQDDGGKPFRLALALAIQSFEGILRANKLEEGILDLNDLLDYTAQIFEGADGGDLARDVVSRWAALFIDEFQDTDGTQKRIIDCLAACLTTLVVVGDPKQSIYRFRGADVSLLDELAQSQMGCAPLRLPIARRPTHVLLRAQNALFAGISDRYPELGESTVEDLAVEQPTNPLDPFVYLRVQQADEVLAIADHVRSLVGQSLPATARLICGGDIVVLVRSNWQVDRLVGGLGAALSPDGISVVAEAGESFFTRPAVVATFRILSSLLDYPNDALLSAALATPYFVGVDPADREAISLQYGVREGAPLTDWFEASHADLAEKARAMREALRVDTAPQFLSRLYETFGIKDHYRALQDPMAVDDLERLREESRRLFRNEEALTVRIFTDALRRDIRANESVSHDEMFSPAGMSLRVMTIHRAKGREFPVVVIPGMDRALYSDRKVPWYVADSVDGLDFDLETTTRTDTRSPAWGGRLAAHRRAEIREEFRLLYVAVTRAIHQVIFSPQPRQSNTPTSLYYSWGNEVLRVYNGIPGAI